MNPSGNTFMDRYLIPVAVILGAVIVALALMFNHGAQAVQQAATNANGQAAPVVNIANVKTANEPFIGNANAPVTMALFFDYQCPYCKQFDQTVLSQIIPNYVTTGKVKVVFKDFQFLGNDSLAGAEFGRAVWAAYPDQYGAWLTDMFNAQDEEGDKGFGNQATIVAMVKKELPAIDTDKIIALIAANKTAYDTAIAADRAEGASYGINGTPSVIIGTQLLQGGQTYPNVAALLDAQLKK